MRERHLVKFFIIVDGNALAIVSNPHDSEKDTRREALATVEVVNEGLQAFNGDRASARPAPFHDQRSHNGAPTRRR
ncbi:hypothetical protein Mal15_27900 [Stieleria maiorica]|uniref:Uncharacterized protein n=1 Tax=Stieleria maiorica TaxID=2795974 RepID=A0A5B9MGS6_9BACT|nr:hypothetical protein Mal15_27900 [Stieleria maiorica]